MNYIKNWLFQHKKLIIILFFLLIITISLIIYKNSINSEVAITEVESYEVEEFIEPPKEVREQAERELRSPTIIDYEKDIEKGIVNILFLGIDSRNNNLVGRSDSILLLSANKETVKLISIPRDSYVLIPEKERYDKVNHAHAFGGPELSSSTVENLFGIKVNHYVSFNFNSFIEVIDTLDGIEIDSPLEFYEQDSKDNQKAIHISKGLQTLNGEEALAYARMRKSDPRGDIGRGERQQQVLKAVIEKATTFENLTKYKEIYDIVIDNVKTNVSLLDVISLSPHLQSIKNVESLNLEGNGKMIGGVYYYELSHESLDFIRNELTNNEKSSLLSNNNEIEITN